MQRANISFPHLYLWDLCLTTLNIWSAVLPILLVWIFIFCWLIKRIISWKYFLLMISLIKIYFLWQHSYECLQTSLLFIYDLLAFTHKKTQKETQYLPQTLFGLHTHGYKPLFVSFSFWCFCFVDICKAVATGNEHWNIYKQICHFRH